jgi:nicotinamidase-related amidase
MAGGKVTLSMRPPRRPSLRIGRHGELPHSPTVLLLIDFINPFEFPEAPRLAPGAVAAARATLKLKDRLVRDGAAVIYANDNYGHWRSDFRDLLSWCEEKEGPSRTLARCLAPGPDDLVILKPRHSAFFSTPLDLVLTQMKAKTLVLAGIAADICVQLTAMDASLHGYGLWVPADCTAAESPGQKTQALAYMKRVLKADVRRSTTRRRLD